MPLYELDGKSPLIDSGAFVHPQATLIGDVEIAEGCYIGAGAVLRGDIGSIKVGKGSNVQENCVVHTFPGEATILDSNIHIGHGSILHGCRICSTVLVGMGSIVADRVKINSNCIIGAGSFVPFGLQIPPNSLVLGTPAKVVKAITQEQLAQIIDGLAIYQELTRKCLESFREIQSKGRVESRWR